MTKWDYTKGVKELGGGVYAYLQPDGSWGYNNAGIIVDGGESLLVDTLFDLKSTQEMLKEMLQITDAAEQIDTLVITHGNGDHFYGNELVKGAEIISTKACAEEMAETPPQTLAELAKAAPTMGDLGAYFLQCFGPFDFEGIKPLPPTRTFERQEEIRVGSKKVQLIEVGPAHTAGDAIVYLPDDQIVFAGDILFIGGTPIMWNGPVANWIKACDLMLEMDVDTIIPGHGPITDKNGVKAVKSYWEYMANETKRRFDKGLSSEEAINDISLGAFSALTEAERIGVNVNILYKEFEGDTTPPNVVELFSSMAKLGLKR